MTIAIDFNGVLCDRQNVPEGQKLGAPIKGSKDALQRLYNPQNKLYIFTDMANTTSGYNAVEDWLNYFSMPWDFITSTKPYKLDVLIDDKAIRFEDWEQTLAKLKELAII